MSGFWNGRRVLVTGAGGFTGSHLATRLAEEEGATVRAFLRHGGSRPSLPASIEVFEGDLTSPEDCRRACEGMDTVFHVAALFRQVKGTWEELEAVHVRATEHLIRAASEAGCRRFVHTSTGGVHGNVRNGPGDEQSPFSPGDDYQETKLEGELLARRLGSELGLPVTVIRPCGIYGPGDSRFLKIVRPVARGRFIMIGPGKVHYHFVYIDDLVRGFILAGEKDAAVGEVFLLGGGESPTLNELVSIIAEVLGVARPRWRIPVWPVYAAGWACEKLCRLVGVEPPLHPRRVAFFTKNRQFSIDKAKRLLDYEPRVGVREGFRRLVESYRQSGLL